MHRFWSSYGQVGCHEKWGTVNKSKLSFIIPDKTLYQFGKNLLLYYTVTLYEASIYTTDVNEPKKNSVKFANDCGLPKIKHSRLSS